MNTLLAILGFLLVMGGWTWYLMLIPAEKVPQRPVAHAAMLGIGMIVSLVATMIQPSVTNIVLAFFSLILGGFFYWLLSQATLPDQEAAVSVGSPLPTFNTTDDTGRAISSTQWQGERILLKFFRGKW